MNEKKKLPEKTQPSSSNVNQKENFREKREIPLSLSPHPPHLYTRDFSIPHKLHVSSETKPHVSHTKYSFYCKMQRNSLPIIPTAVIIYILYTYIYIFAPHNTLLLKNSDRVRYTKTYTYI